MVVPKIKVTEGINMTTRSLNLLLLIPLLILSACTTLLPKDYLVTHEQLDRAWGKSFPLHHELVNGLFNATLATPEVAFLPAKNRISLAVNFSVSSLFSGGVQGRIVLSGALYYDVKQRALYLREPNLESLHVDQGSAALGDTLRPGLNIILNEYLRANPLYQFKPDELRFAGMDIGISSIEVVSDGIKLHLDPH